MDEQRTGTGARKMSVLGRRALLRHGDFRQLNRSRLKQVRSISALMAGFAMEGLVQINIMGDMNGALLTAYGLVTALLIGCNLFALMIATCLLPTLESSSLLDGVDGEKLPHAQETVIDAQAHSEPSSRRTSDDLVLLMEESAPSLAEGDEAFAMYEAKFRRYIVAAWVLSTGLGIVLFCVDMVLVAWIQFYKFHYAAAAVTFIAVPLFFVIVFFGFNFYQTIVGIQLEAHKRALERAAQMTSLSYRV